MVGIAAPLREALGSEGMELGTPEYPRLCWDQSSTHRTDAVLNYADLMTPPKSTSPHPLPTCISLLAMAAPSQLFTATQGPVTSVLWSCWISAAAPRVCPARQHPSTAQWYLFFPCLKVHSRSVPVWHFSWEPRSQLVVKVLARGQCSRSHGVAAFPRVWKTE